MCPARLTQLQATAACCAWLCAFVGVAALAGAERTYRARLRYAKLFSACTSSRRARSRRVPYFSLRKVENLKVWLALRGGRGYLNAFADERAADAVCSSTFAACTVLTLAVLALYFSEETLFPRHASHFELLATWLLCSTYVLRFVGLGSRINSRYQDSSTLQVEMINVQCRLLRSTAQAHDHAEAKLDCDRRLEKRARLQSSLAVLKIAAKLLKDVTSSPSRVSGFAMDRTLYNVARCIFYSALSASLSEWIGLDLKFKPSYFK